ncbi:MAG: corrinoid protein [Clostridia bacterium]
MLVQLNEAIKKGKARDAKELTQKLLDAGVDPETILNEGLLSAMNEVGIRFKNNEIFVPEVLIAARALNMATVVLKPALVAGGIEPCGKALICTVKGDLHDIGKNLVRMMLEGAGIEAIDLGVDVGGEKIVEKIKETGAKVVCLSALLTTTMVEQRNIIQAIKDAGLRDSVKIMVGGAPCTQEWADQIGADAYTPDAASASEKARAYFA